MLNISIQNPVKLNCSQKPCQAIFDLELWRKKHKIESEKELKDGNLQKPVLIMKNSMPPPIIADPIAIFKYQSRNLVFIIHRYNF